MKVLITWNMYDRANESEYIGSINEMCVRTVAQANKWITDQVPMREHSTIEVDSVDLEEIGQFRDAEGIPCGSRLLGFYEPATEEWTWTMRS